MSRPFRSILYVPASNSRALKKLSSLTGRSKPDAVMFDLEDGVGPDNKAEARRNLVNFFGEAKGSSHSYFKMIRVNRMDTPWFEGDASIASKLMKDEGNFDVVLPKIEGFEDLEAASDHFQSGFASLWPMMETPKAILSAAAIASHPNVHGLILGTNDLGKELQLRPATTSKSKSTFSIGSTSATSREGLTTSLQMTILAARAYGKIVIDGVYNNFNDTTGFQNECTQGKEWGMDGKTLIHPNQVSLTNEIFAPSEEEIEYAKRVVECWDEGITKESFSGVAVLDGTLIELLHVKGARKILDSAERIRLMESQ
jgi:(3S)-malyl-CoA thioesterase